jgi:excisionase family DNA binding protein
MNDQQEQLAYTVREASRALGTSEAAVRSMIARRQLPVVRFGRRIFILRADVEHILRLRCFA